MTLRTEQIRTLNQLDAFLEGNEAVDFHHGNRDSAYVFVRRTLVRVGKCSGRPPHGRRA